MQNLQPTFSCNLTFPDLETKKYECIILSAIPNIKSRNNIYQNNHHQPYLNFHLLNITYCHSHLQNINNLLKLYKKQKCLICVSVISLPIGLKQFNYVMSMCYLHLKSHLKRINVPNKLVCIVLGNMP